jgi:hypothetical protein
MTADRRKAGCVSAYPAVCRLLSVVNLAREIEDEF